MKRAKAKITGASLFQFYKPANHINNINAAKYLLYGILTNQISNPVYDRQYSNEDNKMGKALVFIQKL